MMSDVIDFDTGRKRKSLPVEGWEHALLRSEDRKVKRLTANAVLILSNAPEWKDAIAWDAFSERLVIVRDCPVGAPGPWSDDHDKHTAVWLQRSRWRLEASASFVAESVPVVARANTIHPLRAKLSSLVWDKVPRVDTWTTRYLGAADTEVHREMGKRWLLAAVARAFDPGCKVDCALILEGDQGRGKSSAAYVLSLGFFTDELPDLGSKDAAMQLHGAWIVELPELDAIGRAETSRVKAFLTRRSDRYRAPYGRHVAEHPRQCIFIGTVNHSDYLKDETGGRRFLPIETGAIDRPALEADVHQLWAEAVVRYHKRESTYTTDRELAALIVDHTSKRYQGDAWHVRVMSFAFALESVSVGECLSHLGLDCAKWSQPDVNRVAKILKSEGFRRRQVRAGVTREWRYFRPTPSAAPVAITPSGGELSARNHADVTMSPVVTSNNNIYDTHIPQGLREGGGDTGASGDSGDGGLFDDLIDEPENR